jgi:hypothetical protein
MIETHEKELKDAQSKQTDKPSAIDGTTEMLRKLGLTLLPPPATSDRDEEDDTSAGCRLGEVGRTPLTKSSILGKSYNRTLTHYRPWPKMVVNKPLPHEVGLGR